MRNLRALAELHTETKCRGKAGGNVPAACVATTAGAARNARKLPTPSSPLLIPFLASLPSMGPTIPEKASHLRADMYASPGHRYSQQRSSFYSSSSNQSQSYSPTKYGNFDDQPQASGRYYSPPLKSQSFQRSYAASSSYGDYYNNNQSGHYFHQEGTTFYHSSSSTASSSQDGYYGDDLDDFEELRSAFSMRADADPEMTTVPTVPTPISLSLYEHGKTPSGRVLVTSSNQTIEFFSCVVNAPSRGVFVAE